MEYMIKIIGGLNINSINDLDILDSLIKSWKIQSLKKNIYISIFVADKYKLKVINLLEKTPLIYYTLCNKLINIMEHYNNILNNFKFHPTDWIIFTDLGIWNKYRIESFNKCLEGLHNFPLKQQKEIKYFKISRSIYSCDLVDLKNLDNEKVNFLLEKGKIMDNQSEGWGQLIEYCIKTELLENYIQIIKKQSLLFYPNSDRYFLKYINCNKFKFINLNLEKIPISFWMYFYPRNTPNLYFKNIKNIDIYENDIYNIKKEHFYPKPKEFKYDIGTKINCRLGTGVIIEKKDDSCKIKLNWDDKNKDSKMNNIVNLNIKEISYYDKDFDKKNIHLFICQLLNNIELYLSNYVFDLENPPNFKHFKEVITSYIKESKEKLNKDNPLDKLFQILDQKEKIPKECIYDNNLSKNIFEFILIQPLYKIFLTI
jgi:hypothetical protein